MAKLNKRIIRTKLKEFMFERNSAQRMRAKEWLKAFDIEVKQRRRLEDRYDVYMNGEMIATFERYNPVDWDYSRTFDYNKCSLRNFKWTE